IANEFGVPRDDDWLVEEKSSASIDEAKLPSAGEEPTEAEEDVLAQEELKQTSQPTQVEAQDDNEISPSESLTDEEPLVAQDIESEPVPQAVEPALEEVAELDDIDLPEFSEDDALAEFGA
ncbi:hypothetical protein, partial [Vibrio sonorensis]|uniref:hypothetical protein n=1 Tax=Vibrio sonorensis TaxID=1004316 RepID=UPI0015860275